MLGLHEKIRTAESAVRLLRDAQRQPAGHGSAAQQQAAALRAHIASAQATMETIREFAHYQQAQGLVAEMDRLIGDSERALQDLDSRGSYRGPLRSAMSPQEKAEFVGRHGQEKYLALPW